MDLSGKLEGEVELKAPVDKFYDLMRTQMHQVIDISSNFHDVAVHQGGWNTHGSIKEWKYSIDEKMETLKEEIELDDENKTISLIAIEGDVLRKWKSYKVTLRAVPKGNYACVAKVAIDYEKLQPDDSPPTRYLDFCIGVVKEIGAHLANP